MTTARTSRRCDASSAAARSSSCTCALSAFIGGAAGPGGPHLSLPRRVECVHRRAVEPDRPDPAVDLEGHESRAPRARSISHGAEPSHHGKALETVADSRHHGAMAPARLTTEARRVLVGTCLNALGNGFVLPFLVIYLHEVRDISLTVTGAILAVQGAVGLVAVPVYGTLIDRVGARLVQLAALSMSTTGAVVLAYATGPLPAAIAVALLGLGGAGLWPAGTALVAELVPSEARPRYFGLSFALLNLGIGIGGVAGALIVRPGHPGTFQVLFLADAATFFVFIVVLLSLRHVGGPQGRMTASAESPPSYLRLAREPAFRRMVVLQLVIVLSAYSQLDAAFPAFARQLGVSPRIVGLS